MKKYDWILFGILFCAAGLLFLWYFLQPRQGDTVIIRQNGEVYCQVDLYTDRVIDVNGTNTVVIQNGEAYMESADCPDQLCVHQGRISDSRKEIICLPNRVTVSVTKQSDYDAVSR